MVVGQSNKPQVLFIIQARMQSTRLPGKILMNLPFPKGKPLLEWIIGSLKQSQWEHKIVLATSENKSNDILVDFAISQEIESFRGDEENVLSRFIEVIKLNKCNVVVRVTADNPFLDIQLLDTIIEHHLNSGNDYTKSEGLPIGMNFEIVHPKALLNLENEELTDQDCEHVTLHIRNNSKKQESLQLTQNNLQNLRLTVDYPSDFVLASILLSHFDMNEAPNIGVIEKIYNESGWLFELNQNNFQKQQFKSKEEEIDAAISLLDSLDFNHTIQILRGEKE